VLLGLIFFGMIWGMAGMILPTPMIAVVRIVLQRNQITAQVVELLSGRLTGEPVGAQDDDGGRGG